MSKETKPALQIEQDEELDDWYGSTLTKSGRRDAEEFNSGTREYSVQDVQVWQIIPFRKKR